MKIKIGVGNSTKAKLIASLAAFLLILGSTAMLIDESPEAQTRRLIVAQDKAKMEEISKAERADSEASVLRASAERKRSEADEESARADKAEAWAASCRAANATGTTAPAVDCDTVQSKEYSEGTSESAEDIIDRIAPELSPAKTPAGTGAIRPFLLMYGHGLHENGKWQDNGAVLDDGTNERSLVMGIAETVKNHAKPDAVIGRERHTLKDNLTFAQKEAVRLGCVNGKRCFLLAIHANMSEDPAKRGAVAYFNPYDGESERFAKEISACYGGKAVSDERNRWGRLAAVRDVEGVSAVLLETGYMSNGADLEFLKGQAASKLAKCVASVTSR